MSKIEKWIPLVLVCLVVVAYVNSFQLAFILDDAVIIDVSPGAERLFPIVLSPRFLVDLSFKLNHLVGGIKPADYHAVSVVLHLIAGLFLYGITRRTSILLAHGDTATIVAGIIAAVWIVHPLQTASVTYVSQRYEVMVGLFVLMTTYMFIRGFDADKPSIGWQIASIAVCVLGMGTKESMGVCPLLIVVYDYTFMSRSLRGLLSRWRYYLLLFICSWVTFALLMSNSVSASADAGVYFMSRTSPIQYLLTQAGVILHYLRLSVMPYGQCLDYGWPLVEEATDALGPAIIVGALAILTLAALCRRAVLGFLGAWFFITLAPSSSIIPLDDVAFEHRMYLPLAAVIAFIVISVDMTISRLCRRMTRNTIIGVRISALVVVLVALIALTINRNSVYRSEETMWRDVVSKRPHNLRARNDLAAVLSEGGHVEEAMGHYSYVLEQTDGAVKDVTDPRSPRQVFANNSPAYNRFRAFANLGLLEFQRGSPGMAIGHYVKALKISPYSANMISKLKVALLAIGVEDGRLNVEIAERVFGGKDDN